MEGETPGRTSHRPLMIITDPLMIINDSLSIDEAVSYSPVLDVSEISRLFVSFIDPCDEDMQGAKQRRPQRVGARGSASGILFSRGCDSSVISIYMTRRPHQAALPGSTCHT